MRRRRVAVVFALLVLGFAVVQVRLLKLQVVENEIWSWEARRTAMSFDSLPFERGWILDRNGVPLARTEELRDLVFRYRTWRRGAAVGQASLAMELLDERRRSVREAYEWAEDHLLRLSALRVDELLAMEPRARRADLVWYLGRLLGREVRGALQQGMAEGEWGGAEVLDELPGWGAGLVAARLRVAAERDALADLAYQAGTTPAALGEQLDGAVATIDARVQRLLERKLESGEMDDAFLGRRQIRKTFEQDPAVLLSPVPYDTQTLVALRGVELPGFSVRTERRRTYPEGVRNVAPLIVGRVGKPNHDDVSVAERDRLRLADLGSLEDLTAEELAEYEHLRVLVREIDYTYTEERGVLGLERALEPLLRGKRGYVATGRSADGDHDVEIDRAPPQRGLNVTLTLDAELQRACERVLDQWLERLLVGTNELPGVPGSIVLLDPRDGQIRALATSPRPGREQLAREYLTLLQDDKGPLTQRALGPGGTGNLPPPGSTFKPVVALAGLEAGVITPHETLDCDKRMEVGTQTLSCLFRHGPIDMETALAKSCNIYFYKLADRLGGERLMAFAHRFGFGEPDPLVKGNAVLAASGIPADFGLREAWVPLTEKRLARSETMRLGIGQAPLDDVTPLRIAAMMAALGTGELRPPSLIASVEGFGTVPPAPPQALRFAPSHLAAVRAGLEAVAETGTAASRLEHSLLNSLGIDVAGKTGTPQVANRADHSWFAGYMPQRDPVLAFAIFLEHTGEHGGDAGVPLFNALMAEPAVQFHLTQELRP